MEIGELKNEIDRRFEQVDVRFQQMDVRFEQIDRRFEQIDRRFDDVDRRFTELKEQIAEEGRNTRRYFDIALEQMRAERNLVLDQSLGATERLNELRASNVAEHRVFQERIADHEARLRHLEKP